MLIKKLLATFLKYLCVLYLYFYKLIWSKKAVCHFFTVSWVLFLKKKSRMSKIANISIIPARMKIICKVSKTSPHNMYLMIKPAFINFRSFNYCTSKSLKSIFSKLKKLTYGFLAFKQRYADHLLWAITCFKFLLLYKSFKIKGHLMG